MFEPIEFILRASGVQFVRMSVIVGIIFPLFFWMYAKPTIHWCEKPIYFYIKPKVGFGFMVKVFVLFIMGTDLQHLGWKDF